MISITAPQKGGLTMSLTRDQLLTEGLQAKFLRYVQVDSQSVTGTGTTPSSEEQWQMARMLYEELQTLGIEDALLDEYGFVTGTLPASTGCENAPAVGYLAHYDTVPGIPAQNVKPIVHQNYQGQILELADGVTLDPEMDEALKLVVGHDIISSDGRTLLGGDDKAGVAAIMVALCELLKDSNKPHGPFKVGFTPDEEIGTGIRHFDVKRFGAIAAYTLDGGAAGGMQIETFNATNYTLYIMGRSTHPGSARNAMINAIHMAGQFCAMIPATMRPETTDDIWGYIHPNTIRGNQEEVTMEILIRDFDYEKFEAKKKIVESLARQLEMLYPGSKVTATDMGGYRNMNEILKDKPEIVDIAKTAMRKIGYEPSMSRVRGGTDGSQLTFMGLPTPNLFSGGSGAHARYEWVSVPWMEQAAQLVLEMAALWSEVK